MLFAKFTCCHGHNRLYILLGLFRLLCWHSNHQAEMSFVSSTIMIHTVVMIELVIIEL